MDNPSPGEETATVWRCADASFLDPRTDSAAADVCIAVETPIGFIYGGFAYAVMMATPSDLTDFAVGFSLTEGFIDAPADILDIRTRDAADGLELDISLSAEGMRRFLRRRRLRSLRGHTGCGLCGVEDLAGLAPALPRPVRPGRLPRAQAVGASFEALRRFQPLSRITHAAHAAAWCDLGGAPQIVREDVGRHNALDKVLGAWACADCQFDAGFVAITSRCSYEMVQKAATAGVSVLASVSAPTALAIKTARDAGLTLIAPHSNRHPMVYADGRRGPAAS